MFLRPDRDLAQLADNWRIALIARMNRNRAIAQPGFRPGRGDGDVIAGLF